MAVQILDLWFLASDLHPVCIGMLYSAPWFVGSIFGQGGSHLGHHPRRQRMNREWTWCIMMWLWVQTLYPIIGWLITIIIGRLILIYSHVVLTHFHWRSPRPKGVMLNHEQHEPRLVNHTWLVNPFTPSRNQDYFQIDCWRWFLDVWWTLPSCNMVCRLILNISNMQLCWRCSYFFKRHAHWQRRLASDAPFASLGNFSKQIPSQLPTETPSLGFWQEACSSLNWF